MGPDGGAADDLDLALCAAIPPVTSTRRQRVSRIGELLRQAGLASTDDTRPAAPGPALGRRLEQAGVQAQTGMTRAGAARRRAAR